MNKTQSEQEVHIAAAPQTAPALPPAAPSKPSPEPKTSTPKKPAAPKPRNPMFDAIAIAFKYMTATAGPDGKTVYVTKMTSGTATLIGKVAAALTAADYSAEDIPHIYAWCARQGWSSFSPAALEKAADQWRAERPLKATSQPRPAPPPKPPGFNPNWLTEQLAKAKETRP